MQFYIIARKKALNQIQLVLLFQKDWKKKLKQMLES